MTKSDDKMKEEIIMSVVATQVLRRSTRQFLTRCALAFAILTLSLIFTTGASAADKPVPLWLFDVGNTHDGNSPIGGVIADKAGNLYGTTQKGGFPGFGIVLKLTPTSSGLWKETILHTFQGSPSDGATPDSTLVLDSAGNLYGTTLQGGLVTKNPECSPGCGLVFKLTPTASGPWKETIIHRFTGKLDGANPVAGLIQDSAGNLFGSAAGGGTTQLGVAFELSPTPTGWKETVLHNFGGTQGAALSPPWPSTVLVTYTAQPCLAATKTWGSCSS
jgi:hypothetical protein